ncbi:MAG: radical SAM protein [Deltaproteobacteria bacterium]|nr:MAG: radical SAM protein [Deltaproteobacteria bacterium]RLF53060.1 MAG: radical SAM protein [Thermoplasmata archaeon]
MKFLLINPPADYEIYGKSIAAYRNYAPPLGLLYIARALEDEGHNVEIIDFEAEDFVEEKIIRNLNSTDVLGLTVTAYALKNAAKISNLVKQNDQHLPILTGGPLSTIQPEQTLTDINADICVEGEGEKIVGRIAKALEGNENLNDIPGVHYKENNIIKKGPSAELIEDLDSISFPARHLVEKYKYGFYGGVSTSKGKATSMVTSRGCPYNCRFCCVNTITKRYRLRSIDNIMKELDELHHKYYYILLFDDNFLDNKKRAEKIMDMIIERGYNFELGIAGVRVSDADERIFYKMKKAGVVSIAFGIESGNQDVLDFYNKKTTIDQIERAVKLSRKAGLFTSGSFIAGAPIETKEHLKNTFKMAVTLPLDRAVFTHLRYLKGSDLWREAVEAGKIKEHEYLVKADSKRGLGNFSYEELDKWVSNADKRFFLRPGYLLTQFFLTFLRKDLTRFKSAFYLLRNRLSGKI